MPRLASGSSSTTTTAKPRKKKTTNTTTNSKKECPNPLFASWLYEWMEEQREQSATSPSAQKLMFIYSKAYQGILKFPLRLESGRECIQISGIGEKIADRIEKRLAQYRKENNIPEPDLNARNENNSLNASAQASSSSQGSSTTAASKPKRVQKQKAYVPSYRSGAYALILALHRFAGIPSTNNRFYTAWASMEGLIGRELVYRYGNPPRFALTEEGKILGERLETFEAKKGPASQKDMEDILASEEEDRRMSEAASKTTEDALKLSMEEPDRSTSKPIAPAKRAKAPAILYTPDKRIMTSRPEFRRHATPQQNPLSSRTPSLNPDVSSKPTTPAISTSCTQRKKPEETSPFNTTGTKMYSPAAGPIANSSFQKSQPKKPLQEIQVIHILDSDDELPPVPSLSDTKTQRTVSSSTSSFSRSTTVSRSESQQSYLSVPPASNQPTTRPGPQQAPPSSSTSIPAPNSVKNNLQTLYKGTFDIYLVLDSREVRKKNDRSFFQAQLETKGVDVLTRALELGDVIWLAKEKSGLRREIVLDFVIERKTLDDLTSSITDGRFREQKFRLKSCGARNLMYLVEKTTGLDTSSLGTQTMQSAIIQTQILDGFMTKMTRGPDDTLAFLVLMTNELNRMYKDKDLQFIESIFTTKEIFLADKADLETQEKITCFLGFELFQSINQKTKCFTRGDVWTRQLMTIRGVSAEKAASIVRIYPTLQSFMDALSSKATNDERQQLLRKLGDGRKAIGNALSQKMVGFFFEMEYTDQA